MTNEFYEDLFRLVQEKEECLRYVKLEIKEDKYGYTKGNVITYINERKAVLIYSNNNLWSDDMKFIVNYISKGKHFRNIIYSNILIILHEFGHLYLNFNIPKVVAMTLNGHHYSLCNKICRLNRHEECLKYYRKLPSEKYADEFAINFFEKYEDEIDKLTKKHLNNMLVSDNDKHKLKENRILTTANKIRYDRIIIKPKKQYIEYKRGFNDTKLKKLQDKRMLMR